MMRDPEKEYENAMDVQMEMKARGEDMTNDRAVEVLNAIIFLLDRDAYLDEVETAIHMAINALTAQEQLANNSPELDSVFGDPISGKRTEKRTETHACDCIEKQAVEHLGMTGHWIPCSERLPEKNGFYLCTTKDCITILEFIEGNPHYHEEQSFVSDVLGKCNSYVVAWMPLPEPYEDVALHDYFPVSEAERRNWIPCSERLPKEKGLYWVTVRVKYDEDLEFLYSEQREWLGKRWSELSCVHCGVETITAWMPLPEPYREDEG